MNDRDGCSFQARAKSSGVAHGHAGEILQGAISHEGKIRRFLVSLPAPALRSKADFSPLHKGGLHVSPGWKRKSLRAAKLALQELGYPRSSGILHLSDEIPIGRGLGSSTCDCVAVIRAVAAHYDVACNSEILARIAQQAEHASDGTMFENSLAAFLHCEGRLLEQFSAPLPKLRMLIVEPLHSGELVYTDDLRRPEYDSSLVDMFTQLLDRLRTGLRAGDLSTIGSVASASAEINQSYLPKSHFETVSSVAIETQALGVAAAHSGTILTLLYPGSLRDCAQIAEARAMLASSGLIGVRELCTWSDPVE